MIKATNADKTRLIEYLSQDVDNCVYLYIDIKTYDICSENVNVWFDEEAGKIKSVVMRYYDSFQIYSRDEEIDTTWIIAMINEYKLSMVSGPRYLIEKFVNDCEGYEEHVGSVYKCYHNEPLENAEWDINKATISDALEIAEFVCSDKEFADNYTVDVLASQLKYRIENKAGRSFIARDNGVIVGHVATFAESDDVVVLSGVVVEKKYRKTDLYVYLIRTLDRELEKEGKEEYAFATGKRVRYLLDRVADKRGEYIKLLKSNE